MSTSHWPDKVRIRLAGRPNWCEGRLIGFTRVFRLILVASDNKELLAGDGKFSFHPDHGKYLILLQVPHGHRMYQEYFTRLHYEVEHQRPASQAKRNLARQKLRAKKRKEALEAAVATAAQAELHSATPKTPTH